MHWTTHVLSGAALGYLIGRPAPAAAAGFALHPLLDGAPHHDPDSRVGYIADSAAGVAALAILAAVARRRGARDGGAALCGALGSALPDLELLVRLFRETRTEDYIFPWHNGTLPHRQTRPERSAALQVLLLAAFLLLVTLKRRRRLRRASGPGVSAASP